MPWNLRDYLQLGLLIFCVPLQFYLSNNYYNGSSTYYVQEVISDIRNIKETWFSLTSWKKSWINFLSWFVIHVFRIQKEVVDESPAIEVLEFRKKHGLRVKPSKVHLTRPPEVWFRVGQVVGHVYGGYMGVIVEWQFNPQVSHIPVYKILVDENAADESVSTGIVDVDQDQLYLLKNTRIVNRFLKNYFSAYDGSQYIPQPWLQQLYPED